MQPYLGRKQDCIPDPGRKIDARLEFGRIEEVTLVPSGRGVMLLEPGRRDAEEDRLEPVGLW